MEVKKIKLAYKNMISRCYNKNRDCYPNYGGRGIAVCQEWLDSRDDFIEWCLKNGHDEKLSLDRIDNNKNYSPENCRWVDIKTQLRNQRRNRQLTHLGETKTISEWAELIGVNQDTISKRLSRGLSVETSLTAGPLRKWRHGTRVGYECHKCRCDMCKESNNARHRKERLRRKNSKKDLSE